MQNSRIESAVSCALCHAPISEGMNSCPKCHALLRAAPTDDEDKLLVRPFHEIKKEVEGAGIAYDDLADAVKYILSRRDYYAVKYKLLEEQEAEYGGRNLDQLGLEPPIITSLGEMGVNRLYRFQEDSVRSILNGENVVVTAPTGNGKTFAFAVPILHSLLLSKRKNQQYRRTTALFVYPTKALARDQLKVIQKFARGLATVSIFDGDTPPEERRQIIDSPPDIVISNFDTLEYHLRNRTSFAGILKDLRFVAVDELHTYLGAFGSHVYFILRRLRRNNNNLQFIGSSATVRNPKQFAELLFDSSVTEIKCENGRRGRIHFVMIYPSKSSMTGMIVGCVKVLLNSGMKTLVFANTHRNAEVLNLALRREGLGSEIHRAGLPLSQRTQVEQSFKSGSLKSLVATPTLELGIDIGDLDSIVSMITGITTLTQRMGRAGRKGQESVVVLALRNDDPISAFYRNHPDAYFRDISPAYVEPSNPVVARLELLAAAMDRPLAPEEFDDQSEIISLLLKKEKLLVERSGKLWPTPAAVKEVNSKMSIRGIGESVSIMIVDDDRRIGEREMPMAIRELFPHAVYLLAGRKYESVSFEHGTAKVKRLPDSFRYKTEALRHSDPRIVKVLERKLAKGTEVFYCELAMTEIVDGYVVRELFTDKKIGPDMTLPAPLKYTYPTKGFIFKAPEPSKREETEGAFHALEHALIECSDSITGSGSSEIGGVSMGDSGVIFVYDGSPGGSGVARLLYDRLDEAFARTLAILKECRCASKDGCPLCTYSYQCGNNNDPLNKLGAIDSLDKIMNGFGSKIKEIDRIEGENRNKRPYL